MDDRRHKRRGVTLLELLVVVFFIGVLAAVAIGRLGKTALGDFGAEGDARRLSLDLAQARRAAIATGDNHYVLFDIDAGNAVGCQLYRKAAGGDVAVDEYRGFPSQAVVTVSHGQAEFNFEGQALAAYQITLAGPNRTWQADVVPVTGAVRISEL